jgi:tRNA wybutosine-synthesizing protein 1
MKDTSEYLPKDVIAMLGRQHYALFGHSAAKVCHWTKASLRGRGVCYKEKFYGIKSHRCLQMTPAVAWCQQQCVFCWRPLAKTGISLPVYDSPEEIVEHSVKMQRTLLSGFGALKDEIGEGKLKEANNPNQVAISLSGEPTIYPELPELVQEYKKRGFSTFVVSNGMLPEAVAKMKPTQLYLSLEAPDKQLHRRINAPLLADSWERLNESLQVFSGLRTRKVIRVTAVRGYNMCKEKELASLIEKAGPDFVEVKAYMYVGYSRKRLEQANMPSHDEVKEFAERINNHLNYTLAGESRPSRVVLLSRGSRPAMISEG